MKKFPAAHGRTLKTAAVATATAALMSFGLSAASAHVSVSPNDTGAGAYSLLTFSVPHGCDGSPTTKIRINLPEDINEVTPTVNPNWTVKTVEQKLDKPKKLDTGTTITKRMSAVVYTAKTPLKDHLRDALVLSLQLPKEPGKTLQFPTLQTCEQGSTNWNEVPKKGQDEEALDAPAPSITITSADESGVGHGATTADDAADAAPADEPSPVPGYVGLGAGILGLAAGLTALARTRKTKA